MRRITRTLNLEPAVISGVIMAIIPIVIFFGGIDPKLGALLETLVVAVAALFVRQSVMPVVKVADTVLDASTEVVTGLTAKTVGAAGTVTDAGLNIINNVVTKKLGVVYDKKEEGSVLCGTMLLIFGTLAVIIIAFSVCVKGD